MKFSSKFFTYAFIIFLAIVILSCCFSDVIEGAAMRKPAVKPCNKYRASSCPKNRCKTTCVNK